MGKTSCYSLDGDAHDPAPRAARVHHEIGAVPVAMPTGGQVFEPDSWSVCHYAEPWLKPMPIQIGQKFFRDLIPRCVPDHGVDPTVRTQCRCTFGVPLRVAPILNFGRREDR